jgi:hypothetical protein
LQPFDFHSLCFNLPSFTYENLGYADDSAYYEENDRLGLTQAVIFVSERLIVNVHRRHYRRLEGIAVGQRQVYIVYYEAAGDAQEDALYEA